MGVVCGVSSLASSIASSLINKYKNKKSIILNVSFNYKKVTKTAYFYIINTRWLKVSVKFKKNSIQIYNLKWSVSY